MNRFGLDHEQMIEQFSAASAKGGEALRKAVHEATLKGLQSRELTLRNIKSVVKQVSSAATMGLAQNTSAAGAVGPLVDKAIAGIDAALLKAVEANRRALQQLIDQGANLRETQVQKALEDIERVEDMFFDTLRQAAKSTGGPLSGVWGQALDKFQLTGSGAGAHAAQVVAQVTDQAQNALRDGRRLGVKAVEVMLAGYATLASGVLIGMAQGLQTPKTASSDEDSDQKRPAASAKPKRVATKKRAS